MGSYRGDRAVDFDYAVAFIKAMGEELETGPSRPNFRFVVLGGKFVRSNQEEKLWWGEVPRKTKVCCRCEAQSSVLSTRPIDNGIGIVGDRISLLRGQSSRHLDDIYHQARWNYSKNTLRWRHARLCHQLWCCIWRELVGAAHRSRSGSGISCHGW
jgi:hypothetical protein